MSTQEQQRPPSAVDEQQGDAGAPMAARPPADDAVWLHPFLYAPQLKPTVPAKLRKQLAVLLPADNGPAMKEGRAYLSALEDARVAATSACCESGAVSAAGRSTALGTYLGLLQGLLGVSTASDDLEGGADLDVALAEAEEGASNHPPTLAFDSPLRHAATWQWADTVLGSSSSGGKPFSSSDALFELSSMLLATTLASMREAATLCADSAGGVGTAASTQAYRLLREVAGALDWLAASALPQLPPTASSDLDPQVISALSTLALADAQSLTVLRASAKGNQPSLVAALAADTAALYRRAGQALAASASPAAPGSKLAHYLSYKAQWHQGYANLHAGINAWQARQQPGVGLRHLREAAALATAARKAADLFDAAAPPTMNLLHRRHDEQLMDRLQEVQRRMQREADVVYMQRMAAELPPLPPVRRLVSPVLYALPPPATQVSTGALRCFVASSSGAAATASTAAPVAAASAATKPPEQQQQQLAEAAEQGCSCWRWTVFLIVTPLLLLISLVGVVVWIVLLPVKIICCPIGCLIQLLYNVVETLIKAPLRWAAWAAGKPWERAPSPAAAGVTVKE